ncbi:MAG: hypothetical protein ACJAZI_000885 [Cycloclasticus sp.]|jgi:hypothetical protein
MKEVSKQLNEKLFKEAHETRKAAQEKLHGLASSQKQDAKESKQCESVRITNRCR